MPGGTTKDENVVVRNVRLPSEWAVRRVDEPQRNSPYSCRDKACLVSTLVAMINVIFG